jgi:sodium/bile acid cotransporter 7
LPFVLKRLLPDRFVLWLLATVALGLALPVAGTMLALVDVLTLVAIFSLFFLHGIRLPREALLAGVTDWRLHLAILSITFLLFPIAGLVLSALFPDLLSPQLWMGLLFLCALPSTVQSSIAYTSISGGNVAGAVAAAAFSNLIGVFLTPILVAALLEAQGAEIGIGTIGRIFFLLFFPFILGHALRPRLHLLVGRWPKLTTIVDKGTILLAVYGAFSAASVAGVWTSLPVPQLLILVALAIALLAMIIGAALAVGRLGGFSDDNRAAILFCGSVKSLASGAPMARILFPGAASGLVILPLMIFHTIQLIVCAWIATYLAQRRKKDDPKA